MNINMRTHVPILLSATVALALSGCAEKRACPTTVQKSAIAPIVKISDKKDDQIAALKAAIAEAKNRVVVKKITTAGSLYPENAKPGTCYARVLTPAKYDLITEKVVATDAIEKLKVVPAKHKWTKKRVLIKEATQRISVVPAKYTMTKAKVLISQETTRIVTVPAIYKTKKEKVLIREAHTAWKKGRGPVEKIDNATCEILCLVNIPAKYKTITRKILFKPATTKEVHIPAKYKTIQKRVLQRPATTKTVAVPAQYKVVRVKELVEAALVKKSTIPEQYRTIQRKVKIHDAVLKWQEVACKSTMTKVNITSVQKNLKQAGFNPGPIDGIMGWRTKSALNKFQKANNLSTGALTQKTLRALGL